MGRKEAHTKKHGKVTGVKSATFHQGKADIAVMVNKNPNINTSIHPTKSQIKPPHPHVFRPSQDATVNPAKYPEQGANFGASYGVQTGNPVIQANQQRFRHTTVTAAKTIMGFPAAVVDKMGNLIPASNAQRMDIGTPLSIQRGMEVKQMEDVKDNKSVNLVYNPATGYMEPRHNPNPRGLEKNLKKNQFNPFGL